MNRRSEISALEPRNGQGRSKAENGDEAKLVQIGCENQRESDRGVCNQRGDRKSVASTSLVQS